MEIGQEVLAGGDRQPYIGGSNVLGGQSRRASTHCRHNDATITTAHGYGAMLLIRNP